MTFFSKIIPFRQRSPKTPSRGGSEEYARLIVDNLRYIEEQCRKAVVHPYRSVSAHHFREGKFTYADITQENEANELLNEVLDLLRKDDHKALREYRGSAQLTTYITTIINNQLVNIIRSKKGRSRALDRAKEMGNTAERLYELVYVKGFSLSEAHDGLVDIFGIQEPMERLRQMLDRMRGRATVFAAVADGDMLLVPGREVITDEGVELIQTDPTENPEERLSSNQRRAMGRQVILELLESLSGEEKLMIALRFPFDDEEETKSVREIADMLGRTEKAVDNQIRRILKRFRATLLERGLALDDLIFEGNRW